MIKIYLDWNVISGMRNGHLDDFKQLIQNENKFLILYSISHIGDIYASFKNRSEDERRIIDEDLKYIKTLTKGLCMLIQSKALALEYYDPIQLFEDMIDSEFTFEDFSIDKLFSCADDLDPIASQILTCYKELLKSIPLNPEFANAYNDPESSKMLKKVFPGLEENPTMDGFFKSFGQMYYNINEKEDYKIIREVIQKVGVNSSHFNEHKNPFDVINTAYKKMGLGDFKTEKYFQSSKVVPDWFDSITSDYMKIDMHGYKADVIKVNEKEKNTFRNISEDSNHAAFASRCDFYITSDNKNYHKTKKVYEKLGVKTIVLKPNEFIEYYNENLGYHSFSDHFISVINEIKALESIREQSRETGFVLLNYADGREYCLVKRCDKYFFNFFNKIFIPLDKTFTKAHFVLLKEFSANDHDCFVSMDEVSGFVKIIAEVLGVDIYGKSFVETDELIDGDDWCGRQWNTEFGSIVLCFRENSFQLYYYSEIHETE
ncbi:hypothetical protein ACLI08_04245 [Flavobacterium sp. RNTU_13]|uniref:hypothetical protein n=1 Tax=Flavobacterium sp. RNTU_13 TaxID=3375145 RepID=UPI0039863EA0